MAGILSIKDLQARKRALVAESDLYRQTMMIEVQNLRLHSARVRRRLTWFQAYAPLVKVGGPMVWPLLRLAVFRKRSPPNRPRSKFGWIAGAIGVWNLYRKLAPLLATGLAFVRSRKSPPGEGVAPSEEPFVSSGRIYHDGNEEG